MSSRDTPCRLEIGERLIHLSNDRVTVTFDVERGCVSLAGLDSHTSYLSRGHIQIEADGITYDSGKMVLKSVNSIDFRGKRGSGKAMVLRLEDTDRNVEVHVRVGVTKGQYGFSIMTQLKNRSEEEMRIRTIVPLAVDVTNESRLFTGRSADEVRYFRNGFHSWELTQARRVEPGENLSHDFTVIHNTRTSASIVLGFVTMTSALCTISLTGSEGDAERLSRVAAVCAMESVPLTPKASLMSEELLVLAGDNPHALLSEYVEVTADRMRAVPWKHVPTGWCSWYFYYTMPDEVEVLENVRFLSERFPQVEWIQLDDGYQQAVGDWEHNERFAKGLAALVEQVKKYGFKAGVWTAPFIASQHSEVFKSHPEWFIRDSSGQPIEVGQNPLWLGAYYALDLTNPDVVDFVKSLFSGLRDCGFEYFKIDFLYHATQAGIRHDPTKTGAQALRIGLQAVREAVGDALILGCGAPLGPSIGMANVMRIGTDIGTNWRYDWGGGVYACAINTMTRAPLHRKWWINDPDCILVRQDDNDLTLDEVRLWLTIVALSGGSIIMSDRMMEVSEERLRLVDRLLPPYGRGAVAIDAFTNEEPRVFALKIDVAHGSWAVVAAVNLSERDVDISFTLDSVGLSEPVPYHVFEFWTETYEGTFEGAVQVRGLSPHTCRLFAIRPETETPSLLSTSMHFTQGAVEIRECVWDSQKNELAMTLARDCRHNERVFIVFSPRWKPREALVGGDTAGMKCVAPEVIAIEGRFRDGQEIVVKFERKE
ncbi:MAG: hypothetical protein DRO93_04865 [Candidatus Thorarchaeota archaeon]|nr:MAG: hypothetical protein DRO93_04865 [Candidatus Thorarchaeota archaeon]